VSQLPFWALSVYFFWKGLSHNKKIDWVLFGVFSSLGFLSKYLFIYLLLSLFIFFIFNLKNIKNHQKLYIINYNFFNFLIPHFIWLFEIIFVTIFYGLIDLVSDFNLIDHL
jgi:4-amino-4-deoxy-L-arabinose transferase-like glycosyltransferase